MKNFKLQMVLFCIVLIVAPLLINWRISLDHDEIDNWAKTKNYTVLDTEIHFTTFGTPFYYAHKNCFIYEVDVTTSTGSKEHWWVRHNPFSSNDYIKE